jgi:polysaccharide transporter, PST family
MNVRNWLPRATWLKRWQNHGSLKQIIANTGWLFADRILRMGVGLFVGVWVARYLGVEQFGALSYAMAFVALFNTLAQLGLPSLVVRTITNDADRIEQVLGTVFWLQLGGGVVTSVLAIGSIAVLQPGDPVTIGLVALLAVVGVFQAFDTIDLWFQSQLQSKYAVVAKNTAFVIVALGKVALITLQAPLLAFAGATLAESIVGALGLVWFYQRQGYSPWRWRWSGELAQQLMQESWPLILSSLSIMIYMKVDQIMLGQMLGAESVGVYASATRISEIWYFIPMAIAASVSPSIYAAKNTGDESLYYRCIAQSLKVLSLMALVIALPMTVIAGPLVTGLFGPAYAGAGPILAIHIWAAWFVFIGVGSSAWFIAEGLIHLSFQRTLMGGVINIGLNFLLIPAYGGVGAAIATVIAQAFASFLSNAFHPRARKIFQLQWRSLIPTLER